MSDGLVLVFHLSFDQITQRGRLSLLSLLAVLFDGSSLIHHVLGLDGQRKGAVFAIHNNDLGFNFIANIEHLRDRKSTRLNSSHVAISYAVFCLKKKKKNFIKI